ncbi:hypothetical protein [Azospirillum sp.]|uniref:hypothetical protein n=1 Tax=Azospirillum sp. TaxID=34012 RepID=UPI003D71D6B7
MFEDDPWLDAGVEAEDDAPMAKPRHPWFEYAGVEPHPEPVAAPVKMALACPAKDW